LEKYRFFQKNQKILLFINESLGLSTKIQDNLENSENFRKFRFISKFQVFQENLGFVKKIFVTISKISDIISKISDIKHKILNSDYRKVSLFSYLENFFKLKNLENERIPIKFFFY